MSKLYVILLVIVAIYLFYKIKTKKPKAQRNEQNKFKSRDFSDIATEFLFYELINQKPISLPPIKPTQQHTNSYTRLRQQQPWEQQQTGHSSFSAFPQDADEQQTRSLSPLKNKTKPKRKQWGVRVRNKIARSQDWRCAICKELLPEMFHLDHIIPLCNHGKDEIFNAQILCANCHSSKTNDEGIRFGF